MGKNHCISGVNWASMKKFARFVFGEENVVTSKVVDDRHFIIYLGRETYQKKKPLVDKFENEFHIYLKPID